MMRIISSCAATQDKDDTGVAGFKATPHFMSALRICCSVLSR